MLRKLSRNFSFLKTSRDLNRRGRFSRLRVEALESRTLLSGTPLDNIFATPDLQFSPAATTGPSGFSPSQISQAYGFNKIAFINSLGQTVQGDGTGQTIAIVDAYDNPTIAHDLAVFDQTFGLAPPPSFTKVNQSGGSVLPANDTGWSLEIALDVEWAHAMAPKANILLVESQTSSLDNMFAAVNYARNQPGVSVVSMSWGINENLLNLFAQESVLDNYFTTPANHAPVTFIASSGDNGAAQAPEYPAISPNVLAVGGTSLYMRNGAYSSEWAWSGSGGGLSAYEAEPSYQYGVQFAGSRSNPDVSYNADPGTGFAVYDSNGQSGWLVVGGTSAGAPQWASLVAIVNQGRALANKTSLGAAGPAVYSLATSDFHDVTLGTNGLPATPGYDYATGIGSPRADLAVRDLVKVTGTPNPQNGYLFGLPLNSPSVLPFHQAVDGQMERGAITPGERTSPQETTVPSLVVGFFIPQPSSQGATSSQTVSILNDSNSFRYDPLTVSVSKISSRMESGGGYNEVLDEDDSDEGSAVKLAEEELSTYNANDVAAPLKNVTDEWEETSSMSRGGETRDVYFEVLGKVVEEVSTVAPLLPVLPDSTEREIGAMAAVAGLAIVVGINGRESIARSEQARRAVGH